MSLSHEDGTACYAAACEYLEYGWNAIPICTPDHLYCGRDHGRVCQDRGKQPLLDRWKPWQTARITASDLRFWWRRWPNANVGIILGSVSGICGLDVEGDTWQATLAHLAQGETLPETWGFRTGRGRRWLYRLDKSSGPIATRHFSKGVSLLAERSLTVMPPSRHKSSQLYQWENKKGEIATLPTWLRRQQPAVTRYPGEGCVLEEGVRNTTLFRMACALRRFGAIFQELFVSLCEINKRCQPPLDLREITQICHSACRYVPAVSAMTAETA